MIIPEHEKLMMENYINAYSGGALKADMNHILRFWSKNKTNLYQLLGNSLTYTFEATLEKDNGELRGQYRDKARENPNITNFTRAVEQVIEDYNHEQMELETKKDPWGFYSSQFYGVISFESVFDNIYKGNGGSLDLKGHSIKIVSGMKTMKIIARIAKEFIDEYPDLRYFEDFRLAVSQILNDKSYKGKITFSIHPLDFMTMSDNECDWSSCMSWRESGCYRMGTVEMMNSPYVLVAYIESKSPLRMPDGTVWNNKRWRELFIVDKQGIFAIKGYPYWNKEFEKVCLSALNELAHNNLGWESFDPTYHNIDFDNGYAGETYYTIPTTENKIHMQIYTNNMYNDLRYNHHLAILPYNPFNIDITYSGEAECMCCGEKTDGYNSEEYIVCDKCDNSQYCTWCDERCHADEGWVIDGQFICNNCYDDAVANDVLTEEPHLKKNMICLNLRTARGQIDSRYWVHKDTMESDLKELFDAVKDDDFELLLNEALEHIDFHPRWDPPAVSIYIKDLTNAGCELFGYSQAQRDESIRKYIEYREAQKRSESTWTTYVQNKWIPF